MTMPEAASIAESLSHLAHLDQELAHLPDKLRLPIVLCDLECKTRKEAARQLDSRRNDRRPVSSRASAPGAASTQARVAAFGRHVGYRKTLFRHGFRWRWYRPPFRPQAYLRGWEAIATGMISTPVAALTEGVLKAMLLKKIKIMLAALVLLMLASSGVGLLAHQVLASEPIQAVGEPAAQPKQAVSNNTITVKHLVVEAVDAARNTISVVSAPPIYRLNLEGVTRLTG